MTRATSPTTVPPMPSSGRLPTYRMLCRRLRRLKLAPDVLVPLRTYGDLQRVARHQYYHLAKHYHPDHEAQRRTGQRLRSRPLTGATFQMIAKTYQWLQQVAATTPLPRARGWHPEAPVASPRPRARGWLREELYYDTPPIAEQALPFALERRPVRHGWGWQILERWE